MYCLINTGHLLFLDGIPNFVKIVGIGFSLVLVWDLDLFSLNWFMTFEQRYTTVAFIYKPYFQMTCLQTGKTCLQTGKSMKWNIHKNFEIILTHEKLVATKINESTVIDWLIGPCLISCKLNCMPPKKSCF